MQTGVRMKQKNDYRWWPKIGKCKKHFLILTETWMKLKNVF